MNKKPKRNDEKEGTAIYHNRENNDFSRATFPREITREIARNADNRACAQHPRSRVPDRGRDSMTLTKGFTLLAMLAMRLHAQMDVPCAFAECASCIIMQNGLIELMS